MRDVVICEPLRTPVGAFAGGFKNVAPETLATAVVKKIMENSGFPAELVEDVIFANCYPTMEAPAFGRVVSLNAGLPVTACGYQIDRRCGSGLQAVINGVMQVASGGMEAVIAGGAESMSRAPFYSVDMRWGAGAPGVMMHDGLTRGRITAGGDNYPVEGGMIETAENLRKEYGIARDAQDELSVRSHKRASAAEADGKFAEEIVPITVPNRKGDIVIDKDEHIRHDSNLEALAKLRAIRSRIDPDSTVTAGNASGQNDGAAACLITTRELAEKHGLKPLARMKSWGLAGVGPAVMGIGPVKSSQGALERAGLTLKDLDLIELNEAFAAQVLACTKALGLEGDDFDRINVNGSGISLGHPVGATGARILTTLLREMDRREAKYGLETMCIGGGQGLAAVFERVE
ncbi:acetyl-CoA C-acetyltransferase [Ponticaulis sp.]|uniref:acetyl-CoA C-acetyltransferase n=1 Tax=Ponticaulis sp. TaxID=2020902 RepID=UPI000B6E94CE|nr:acetyl-CoA C-acetyltransferase [Ponticaulis sp.]MAI91680.1 acetyl-CoA C-acyltransferase [Ponticaulis sp.]OUX96943.1 MAG: acetyl-CoA acetyltransferase [Hyphomonadaceae bacterium TMED5]|tara:strand:+ start:6452 stop:7663 length:1212 start_codon:yes stop_codon:yes gene_type:complete